MNEEICQLGLLVNEFGYPFHPYHDYLERYKTVKITSVEQQLQWKNNLKLNTLSLIMSIGAVQSHKEWLGKEYDRLFKFSNCGDFEGTKRNGRSVFRNYSMLNE